MQTPPTLAAAAVAPPEAAPAPEALSALMKAQRFETSPSPMTRALTKACRPQVSTREGNSAAISAGV